MLTAAGFWREFGKGDHWKHYHRAYDSMLLIDPRKPVLAVYVTKRSRQSKRLGQTDEYE